MTPSITPLNTAGTSSPTLSGPAGTSKPAAISASGEDESGDRAAGGEKRRAARFLEAALDDRDAAARAHQQHPRAHTEHSLAREQMAGLVNRDAEQQRHPRDCRGGEPGEKPVSVERSECDQRAGRPGSQARARTRPSTANG